MYFKRFVWFREVYYTNKKASSNKSNGEHINCEHIIDQFKHAINKETKWTTKREILSQTNSNKKVKGSYNYFICHIFLISRFYFCIYFLICSSSLYQ